MLLSQLRWGLKIDHGVIKNIQVTGDTDESSICEMMDTKPV